MSSIRPLLIVLCLAAVASAQVSFEEAQRRLNAKLSTKPASTQPVSETDRLRAENRRLREENVSLQTEISQLRDALAKSTAAASPTSEPTAVSGKGSPELRAKLLGKWQGGELARGTAFITQFADDGTYRQSWLAPAHVDNGHWDFISDDVIQMWSGPTPRHPLGWRISGGEGELVLTPVSSDGTPPTASKVMVLKHTP